MKYNIIYVIISDIELFYGRWVLANTRQARAHAGSRIAAGAVLITVSLFCFLCVVGTFGSVGKIVSGFLVGFFGLAVYGYTIAGAILGVALTFGIRFRMRPTRALFFIGLLMLGILALQIYTSSGHIVGANYGEYLRACYHNTNTAGGMLYGLAAFPLMRVATTVGALVIACIAFLLLAFLALFPSIRRNVTYTAPVRKVRKTTKTSEREAPEPRFTRKARKERTAHSIDAATAPVITDLSQAEQGGSSLYVVDVAGDPMPQKRGFRRAKGADGYKPLGTFDPLYPNRNGGYEDELIAPQSRGTNGNIYSPQGLAKDILFGENPSQEVLSRYESASNPRNNAIPSGSAPYSAVKRGEMRSKLGVDNAQDTVREDFMRRYRALGDDNNATAQTAQNIIGKPENPFGTATEPNKTVGAKPDYYSLIEERERTFAKSPIHAEFESDARNYTVGGDAIQAEEIKREVVKPSRVMPHYDSGDAINGTIRKAENAVNSNVNVGMYGALNRAMSGGQAAEEPVKEEITSQAYDKPQIIPIAKPIQAQTAKLGVQENGTDDTVIKNGEPTSISALERPGYTPVSKEAKIPRAFSGTSLEKDDVQTEPNYFGNGTQPKPNMQSKPAFNGYEMSKPTLDNPRLAYVDENPTQGGLMPSEPAPIRQKVTGGDMSRAAIQSTTDIAKQSAKDKENAEMQSRIQNIKQAIKETPNIGQYEREALRAEKVKSSQNRGLFGDEQVRSSASSQRPAERIVQNNIEQEIAKSIPRRPYAAPPVSLLEPPAPEVDQNEDYEQKKERIVRTLEFFNIKGEVVEIKVGPTFTMYKLKVEMPRGRTINYISSLESDIAMKMEAGSVRIIAPIPGEDAIGIEVPNKKRRNVNLSEIIESPEFNRAKDPASFALGKNLYGVSRVVEVRKLPHVLIAGATGAGKSCCINSLIVSLLYKASPDDVRLILVDPKRVEMSIYAGIPHLLMDEIICDTDKAIRALNWAIQEMERRMKYFAEVGYRDIEGYNADVNVHGYEKMARIVIVVDEFADLMSTGKKAVEDTVNRIARLARATGIHLVLATQRPSVDVISGTIKNNFPSRVAFKVTSSFDSKTILDSVGADKLLGYGDLLFMSTGASELERMQGAFISNEEVKKVVDFIKQHNDSYFDNNIKDAIFKEAEEERTEFSAKEHTKSKDELPPELFKALELGIELREDNNSPIAISFIQRKLGLGWPKAAKIYDMMDDMGFLTPVDPSDKKKKAVNITYDQLEALRNSGDDDEDEE